MSRGLTILKVLATSLAVVLPLVAVLIVVTLGAFPTTSAKTQSCTVSPSGQCSVTFNLRRGDQVSGSVSIKGNSAGETNFWVADPTGANIYNGGKVSSVTSFLFSAGGAGAYVLHFNSFVSSLTTRLVTLNYNVVAPADC